MRVLPLGLLHEAGAQSATASPPVIWPWFPNGSQGPSAHCISSNQSVPRKPKSSGIQRIPVCKIWCRPPLPLRNQENGCLAKGFKSCTVQCHAQEDKTTQGYRHRDAYGTKSDSCERRTPLQIHPLIVLNQWKILFWEGVEPRIWWTSDFVDSRASLKGVDKGHHSENYHPQRCFGIVHSALFPVEVRSRSTGNFGPRKRACWIQHKKLGYEILSPSRLSGRRMGGGICKCPYLCSQNSPNALKASVRMQDKIMKLVVSQLCRPDPPCRSNPPMLCILSIACWRCHEHKGLESSKRSQPY